MMIWASCFPVRFLSLVGCVLLCLSLNLTCAGAGQMLSGQAAPAGLNTSADSEEDSTVDEDWLFRFELFQGLLEQSGLTPVTIDKVFARPEQSVVVLTGDLTRNFSSRMMEQFCAKGGHLLLACDSGFSGGRIAEFRPGPVVLPGNRNRYQNYPDCIVVSDFPSDHPTTKGVQQLILNRTGWLEKPRWFLPEWEQVARLPDNVSPTRSRSQSVILQVKTTRQMRGRMLVTADHSLFTNGMLWHGDNALFAIQVAEWLAEEERDQLLFLSDGQILGGFLDSPTFQPQASTPPDIPIPEMDLPTLLKFYTSFANNVIQRSQQQNLTNELLARRPRNMPAATFRRWLVFALVVVIVLFAIWRFTATSYNFFHPIPKRKMKSALELSHEELTRHDELNRAASMLARDLCTELTGSTDSRVWVQQLSKQSLSTKVMGLASDERARLGQIVSLATNSRSVPVSRKRLEELGKMIYEFRRRHKDLTPVTG